MRRLRGDRGTAMVTALVFLFALTAGAVIWLSRDVNRRVSNRAAAQSIAFQAARSGAQQVDVASLRDGAPDEIMLDPPAARSAAAAAAERLGAAYGFGRDQLAVAVTVRGLEVAVTVTLDDSAGPVTGVGVAEARSSP